MTARPSPHPRARGPRTGRHRDRRPPVHRRGCARGPSHRSRRRRRRPDQRRRQDRRRRAPGASVSARRRPTGCSRRTERAEPPSRARTRRRWRSRRSGRPDPRRSRQGRHPAAVSPAGCPRRRRRRRHRTATAGAPPSHGADCAGAGRRRARPRPSRPRMPVFAPPRAEPNPGTSDRPETRRRGSTPPGERARGVPGGLPRSSDAGGRDWLRVHRDRRRTRRRDRRVRRRRWAGLGPSCRDDRRAGRSIPDPVDGGRCARDEAGWAGV